MTRFPNSRRFRCEPRGERDPRRGPDRSLRIAGTPRAAGALQSDPHTHPEAVADNIGMNDVQFRVMMITALGLNLFAVSGTTGESILRIAYRTVPFVLIHAGGDTPDRIYPGKGLSL